MLAFNPFASRVGGSRRPVHVIQRDAYKLATLAEDRFDKVIGSLPDTTMAKVSQCLKAALAIS